ncbi:MULTISPECIES: GIY-YIG nuclease family protein [unclassified Mycoplasma]|uniref:GIY-YIG nuclease family protein n=1 Tax=unclassified Mycoplasma TaxID=2683645 RepID=UPI00216B2502|nr:MULTISPECIES: GIY-YIG nuclease family protein [unclassified Mycoplasma]MCS4537184.1 GIY-YIG nuclease family protein [Mycoplasma sp. CSL7475-4]MCT4469939.1 GIY-YIG nuclease family protein [Mycoplasma sp. HS2188]
MSNSKNFNLFLMDGDVTGRIKCTMANWTGLAFKVPRLYLDKSKDRQDLKQSGVYFLFGKNDDDEDQVYIGQAGIRKNGEGILFRVMEHLKDPDYFNEAVILTTQNNSFGPTEISYLENRFTNMASSADRLHVMNSNDPNAGHVTEEKESELEDFVEYSKMALGVLGYKVFVPVVKQNIEDNNDKDEDLMLHLSVAVEDSGTSVNYEANCLRTSEGFVVLKGSAIRLSHSVSLPKSLKEIRDKCRANNEIVDGKLTKNILFNSPSYASSFVLGRSSNGRVTWKTVKDNITLKEFEERQNIDE